MLISIPIHQVCTEKVDFSLKSDYCGIFNVKIKSIQIFDFIKLFSVRIKNKKTCQITVLPELYPIITANTPSIINTEESNIFSKHKSGDDPSEIFELKDYVQGDKPNKIHWKLSLKHDNYIVRHYSQPISSSILVMLDFSGEPSKRHIISLDTAAEMAFSILVFFIENETPAKFSYFDAKKGSEEIMPATDISEITTAFKNIFLNYPTKHNSLGSILLDSTQNYSKIFYITYDPNNLSEVYKKNNCENFVPIFIKNLDNDKSPKFEFPENAIIIPAGKTGEIISNILI